MAQLTFGETIRAWREYRGLNNHDLSAQAGIEASQVSRIEGGHIKSPQQETLEKIARVLQVSPRALLARFWPGDYVETLLLVESQLAALQRAKSADQTVAGNVLAQISVCDQALGFLDELTKWIQDRRHELEELHTELTDRDGQQKVDSREQAQA